jgi:hypothetical protein
MTKINRVTLILLVALTCYSKYYSQTQSKENRLKVKQNSKGLSLKIKDLETNGKTNWTVKTILNNNSRDTLFYFSFVGCETGYYLVGTSIDTLQVSIDYKNCSTASNQTVIAIPPSDQRTVNLEIISQKPLASSIKLTVYLHIYKAKNLNERFLHDDLMKKSERRISLISNQIKIRKVEQG